MPEEPKDSERSKDLIADNLKEAFRETLDEGVPDRFKDLLAQLKEANPDNKSKGDTE